MLGIIHFSICFRENDERAIHKHLRIYFCMDLELYQLVTHSALLIEIYLQNILIENAKEQQDHFNQNIYLFTILFLSGLSPLIPIQN